MSIIYLFKLLIAHILSDFLFQPTKLVEAKNDPQRISSLMAVLLHSLVHAIVAYLIMGLWANWIIPVVIFVTHFMIDFAKVICTKDTITAFLVDQGMHVAVIVLLWVSLFTQPEVFESLTQFFLNPTFWVVTMAYLVVLQPSSVLLSKFIKKWMPISVEADVKERDEKTLPMAGKWIGYFERILILTFIFLNQYEGIGFLLAAKSIFRFGDLRDSSDIKQTEYVLAGTFASFTIACIVGVLSLLIITKG